ncbi:PAS domain S-box protein [Anabaena azotica]|uniref:histidine kinase n=1 Tax=Anabaena azotica FACHB-119 TaxID=947527 RepID=A0ABR8CVS8_9NOST|nr:PAS domain S-box protein [Anabaena azotica]MBD2499029.1 PAS domain S-box protein [Anabaena azotica FACHB-119]
MLPDKKLIVFILAWLMLAVIQVMALYQGKACNFWFPVVRGAIALTLGLELIAIIVAGIVLLIKTIQATKQQVYNNEANLRAAIGNILDGFGIYSAIRDRSGQIVDFHIEYVNTAACVSNGCEEQTSRRLGEILPQHKESGLFAQYCQVVETGQTLVKDELIYEDNDQGQPLTRVFNIRAAKFQDGFVVNWQDITERHRAEQAVLRQQQELATLVENIPGIVTRFDSQLRYIYANSIHEQITGLKSAALIGKNLSEVWANEPQAPQWEAVLQAALQEQSAAQAALAESEERLRLALKAANQGLYDLNIQTGEAVVTPEYAQMLGYDPDGFKETNQAWRDRLHPDDRKLVYRVYQEYIAGKTDEYRVEFRQRTKSGDWLWILSIGKIVAWDEQGNPLRMLGTHTDITKRKQSELALQNALQLLNLHIDTTPLALVQWDDHLCVTRWSSAAEKIFGWRAEEVLGRYIQDLHMVYEEDVTAVAQVGDRLLSGQESQIINYNRNYTKDGKVIHCEWYNSTTTDETGRVSSILSLVLDVTERTKAEKAIRQSELKFRTLADTMPQMVWITKPDGYHEYFNQRWYDYTGKTLEQTQGEGWQYILHPDDVEPTFAVWQNSLQTGNSYNIEYRLRRGSDGEYRWHLGKALPLKEQNGQIVKWFGSCTDIHDQKLLIEERAQALERERAARIELEKASRMKDEFLAIVSHELRSPLNGILGWSRLLRTRKLSPDKIQQALESIERNAQAQTQLIEDLLDISRIIRGNIRLNLRPTNLIPVILAALDTVRPVANSKSIQIDSRLDADVVVAGDPERLQQVVWNLLSNAVKFTPEGGRVEIRLAQVETNVQIQVIDTGKGISLEFLPYVFDRFRQADSTTTRNQGGLGLGLAIVRNLVQLHSGQVAVTSLGEGTGATFTVELPILPTPLSITAEQLLIQRQTAWDTNIQITGLKILIVDDEPDTREFLQTALEQYGATVTTASSAREALQLVPVVKPDVILSDIGMPEEDGYSLIRKIRALPSEQGGNVPAAALTAYARQSDRQQALTAGFQIHIPKPIEPIQLLKVVASLAGRIS